MCSSFIKQGLEDAAVVEILPGGRNWITVCGDVSNSAQPLPKRDNNSVSENCLFLVVISVLHICWVSKPWSCWSCRSRMCPFLSCGQHIPLNILTLVPLLGGVFHPGASNPYFIVSYFFLELMVVTFGSSCCLQEHSRCPKTQNTVSVVNPRVWFLWK